MIERPGGDGVLIMTGAPGCAPSDVAIRLREGRRTPMLAGVHLPMIVRVCKDPQRALNALARAALDGGRRGITLCPPSE